MERVAPNSCLLSKGVVYMYSLIIKWKENIMKEEKKKKKEKGDIKLVKKAIPLEVLPQGDGKVHIRW